MMFSSLFTSTLIAALSNTLIVSAQDNPTSPTSVDVSTANNTLACSDIEALYPSIVTYEDDLIRFQVELHTYWSQACANIVPTCIVFPTETQQVSDIVRILNDYPDVGFAVKSGGHNSNTGLSSVQGGVLIALSEMAATTISDDLASADVQPGARWASVATTLDEYGKTVVGGRLGGVGVGGYLLGGGLSFLSTQYG